MRDVRAVPFKIRREAPCGDQEEEEGCGSGGSMQGYGRTAGISSGGFMFDHFFGFLLMTLVISAIIVWLYDGDRRF